MKTREQWSLKLTPYEPTRIYSTCFWHFAYPCGVLSTHYPSRYECRLAAESAKKSETDMVESIKTSVRAAFQLLRP